MRPLSWTLVLPAVTLLAIAACSSSTNGSNSRVPNAVHATAAGVTTTHVATPVAAGSTAQNAAPAVSSGTPAATTQPQAPRSIPPTVASTGATGQVEQELLAALINADEVPSNLTKLVLRQPLNNQQYAQLASAGGDVASIQKKQIDAGRISGAVASFASPDAANPPASGSEITNLLVILSDYSSPTQASAAMPDLIKALTPSIANASALSVTKQIVPLRNVADETAAESINVAAALGDRPDALVFWVVGVRRGAVVELYIETGIGGVPSSSQILDTIMRQDSKVAMARL